MAAPELLALPEPFPPLPPLLPLPPAGLGSVTTAARKRSCPRMPTVRIDAPPAGPPVTTPATGSSMNRGLESSTGPSDSDAARLKRERTAPATPATNSSPNARRPRLSAASRSITRPEAPESTRKRPGAGTPSMSGRTRRCPDDDSHAGTSLQAEEEREEA